MPNQLTLRQHVELPHHPEGDFDHGDMWLSTGEVFAANTAAGTVEVIDGERLRHLRTIPGCPEASGVFCAQDEALVFAAARGAGTLLVIDPITHAVLRTVEVGPRPNGLAYSLLHHYLLVVDVQDSTARLVDPQSGQVIAATLLPGRPGFAVYDQRRERFLVNIREPALVAVLDAEAGALVGQFPVSVSGPHGLDAGPARAAGRSLPAMEAASSLSIPRLDVNWKAA